MEKLLDLLKEMFEYVGNELKQLESELKEFENKEKKVGK